MSFWQTLSRGAFPLVKIRHGIESKPIHAKIEPEFEDAHDLTVHCRVVKVEIRLMRVKPMPEIRPRHRVPRPIGRLKILEDDSHLFVLLRRIAPDIKIPLLAPWLRPTR